jgi:hypothetical protein
MQGSLAPLPKNRYISMRLYYKDNIPAGYKPRYFTAARDCKGVTFAYEPLNLKVGKVETPHHSLHLRCKSTIDNYVIRYLKIRIVCM